MDQMENTTSSDIALMENFIAQHGEPPKEKSEARLPSSPSREPSEPRSANPDSPEREEEEESLDVSTLEALGLIEGDDEEGTPERQVDLAGIAETLGLDPADLSYGKDGLRIKTKVDGETGEVSLAELRKGYQLQSHFTRQQEAFLAERQQWEQARAQREQYLQQQEGMAQAVLQQEEQALKAKFTRNDWDQLRRDDPAEYAAMVAEYNQQLSDIRGRQQNLARQMQQRQQETTQQWQQQMAQVAQQEQRALVEKLGWKSPEQIQANGKKLQEYLFKQGFSEQDLAGILDHRAFVLAEKARKYEELAARVDLAKKKIAEAPNTPSGKALRPVKGDRRKLSDAQDRLRKNHSDDAAAEVFRLLKVI